MSASSDESRNEEQDTHTGRNGLVRSLSDGDVRAESTVETRRKTEFIVVKT